LKVQKEKKKGEGKEKKNGEGKGKSKREQWREEKQAKVFDPQHQLLAHTFLVSHNLRIVEILLDALQKPTEADDLTVLHDILEVLDYQLFHTKEVNQELKSKWFDQEPLAGLWKHWRETRAVLAEKRKLLEEFLPSPVVQVDASTKSIPIESVFELSVQCFLDISPHLREGTYGKESPILFYLLY
jgi:hypothetical protein